MVVRLVQPGSGKAITVADRWADYWRGLGYRDEDALVSGESGDAEAPPPQADPPAPVDLPEPHEPHEQGEAESPPPPPSRRKKRPSKSTQSPQPQEAKEGSDPDG